VGSASEPMQLSPHTNIY